MAPIPSWSKKNGCDFDSLEAGKDDWYGPIGALALVGVPLSGACCCSCSMANASIGHNNSMGTKSVETALSQRQNPLGPCDFTQRMSPSRSTKCPLSQLRVTRRSLSRWFWARQIFTSASRSFKL